MTDVKAAIQLLCSTLNLLLRTNLTPEYFRLSKFDKDDKTVIHEFWTTLHKLLTSMGPEVYSSKDESMLKIKLQLAARGYNSVAFYTLPSDESSGSRELLLALAWLIAQGDALVFMTHKRLKASLLCKEFKNDNIIKPQDSSKKPVVHNLSDESDKLHYLMVLAGRIRHFYKEIVDVGEEQAKHISKVHSSSTGASGLPHLSVGEVELINEPKLLAQSLPELQEIHSLLDLLQKWSKKKHIFWEWMETVLEQKEKTHSKYSQLPLKDEQRLEEFLKEIHVRNNEGIHNDGRLDGTKLKHCVVPRFVCDAGVPSTTPGDDQDLEHTLSHAREQLMQVEQQHEQVLSQLDDALRILADRISVHVISDQKSALVTDRESEETSR